MEVSAQDVCDAADTGLPYDRLQEKLAGVGAGVVCN